ncbi:MAG TPA: fatty acid desaturase, partial [Verrucomicrobiae bacterium]|nr:fatty acid desaturase [Verrucomicrobiae bacterium]
RYHIKLGLYNRSPLLLQKKLLRQWLLLAKYIKSYSCYIIQNRIYDALSLNENCKNMLIFNAIMLSLFVWLGIIKYYFLFWIIPMLIFYPLIGWLIELSEHYPLVQQNRIDIMMSRNRFSHWLEGLFFNIHNENYHLTHHLKPRVPFWNIKRAHFILMSDEIYCKINQAMGGIFLSRNRQETVLRQLLLYVR